MKLHIQTEKSETHSMNEVKNSDKVHKGKGLKKTDRFLRSESKNTGCREHMRDDKTFYICSLPVLEKRRKSAYNSKNTSDKKMNQ